MLGPQIEVYDGGDAGIGAFDFITFATGQTLGILNNDYTVYIRRFPLRELRSISPGEVRASPQSQTNT